MKIPTNVYFSRAIFLWWLKRKKTGDCRTYYLRIEDLEYLALPHSPQILRFKIFKKKLSCPKTLWDKGINLWGIREMKKCTL